MPGVDADHLFDEIVDECRGRGAEPAMMFGKRALKAHGKGFACLKGEAVAFRLVAGTPEHAEALALEGAQLFDPSAKDRPFKDWVSVPLAEAEAWPRLALVALDRLTSA